MTTPTAGGTLEAIWIKRMRRGPMDPAPEATLVAGRGIEGNSNQGGKRHVTIIEREVWDRMMSQVASPVDPSSRRANLLVSGLPLANSRGRLLRVGECLVRIEGETKPCRLMDEACPGLREVMFPDWHGGAYGEVIEGGSIAVGDPVAWAETREPAVS